MRKYSPLAYLALVLLTGCATEYHEVGYSGGYAETQLSRNEFVVTFTGNGYTSGQRAIDLCLLRCAELALGHGFHYFVLTGNNVGYDMSTAVTVGSMRPTVTAIPVAVYVDYEPPVASREEMRS